MRLRDLYTLGIPSSGNIAALTMCLTSVLCATTAPGTILLYLTGDTSGLSNFYLEQLSALARFHGICFGIFVGKKEGVRRSRDFLLDNCATPYLWMLDDDVIVDASCFEHLVLAADELKNAAYFCATKGDVNNRRGYDNFDLAERPHSEAVDFGSFNHFYAEGDCLARQCHTMDTGNVLLNMECVGSTRFQVFDDSTNCGGEDALFGLLLQKKGMMGRWCPNARSYHLEKPQINFGEFAARGEALSRTCDILGLDKKAMQREMMPWLWKI